MLKTKYPSDHVGLKFRAGPTTITLGIKNAPLREQQKEKRAGTDRKTLPV
jgi:hypothetical protein